MRQYKAVFIVGQPRSGTTPLARIIQDLTLCSPIPGSGFEPLNPQGLHNRTNPELDSINSYYAKEPVYGKTTYEIEQNIILEEALARYGEAGLLVKDVCWPWVIKDFAKRKGLPLIIAVRDPIVITYCCKQKGHIWKHPCTAYGLEWSWENVLRASMHRQRYIFQNWLKDYDLGCFISLEEVIHNPERLKNDLHSLGLPVRDFDPITQQNKARLRQVEQYRDTEEFQKLQKLAAYVNLDDLSYLPNK